MGKGIKKGMGRVYITLKEQVGQGQPGSAGKIKWLWTLELTFNECWSYNITHAIDIQERVGSVK